jgi:methionine aminotransferase
MTGVPGAARGHRRKRCRPCTARGQYCATTEITVTAGATQAILTAILAIVHPGDEVIVLEPCYDSYVPNIELAGGTVVRVPLVPGTSGPTSTRSPRPSRRAPAPS